MDDANREEGPERGKKAPYRRPALVEYGSIPGRTLGTSAPSIPDGGVSPMNTKMV